MRPFLSPIIFLLFISCGTEKTHSEKVKVIEHLLDSLFSSKVFNGAIVVAQGDSVIFSKGCGFADFKDSIPFTPRTLSDGGSLAKTFTAAALWKLQKQGKLSLKDAVEKYLPGYPYPSTTILDLITHNAGGLPDYDDFYSQIRVPDTRFLTNEMMLSLLGKKKFSLIDTERKGFNYENTGYDLAALIIEMVTGKKYEMVLSDFYFRPLQMDSTRVRPQFFSQWKAPRTIGYLWKKDSLTLNDIEDGEGFYGGSNLHFTSEDLCKWGTSFYNSMVNTDILSEANKPAEIEGQASGLTQLNWYYSRSKKAFYYWGNVAGFYSHMYYDVEKKFSIAYMTNTTLAFHLRQPLAAALVDIMENGDYDKKHFSLPSFYHIENRSAITGTYKTMSGDTIRIFQGEKLLHVQTNSGLRYNMYLLSDGITGYVPGIDAWISFVKAGHKLTLHWKTVFRKEEAEKVF